MKPAIQVENLCKQYGATQVLKGISFEVPKGEIFGLLGTNGAGKTTTLECVEGLKEYQSGTITCNGTMGIQLQSSSLPPYMHPIEALQLFAKWKHTTVPSELIETFGLQKLLKKQYSALSTGQKRRLHLALALLGNPDILFLDEPTAGLDVEARIALHSQIRQLKAAGKTIVLASHDMQEVETLCDTIAILHNGNIAFTGTVQALTQTVGKQYTITVFTTNGQKEYTAENISATLLQLLEQYQQSGIEIQDIKVTRGTLEQHFIHVTKGVLA